MTDRNDLNFPASVTAATFGVLLIGISIPLLMLVGGAGGGQSTYSVTWFEASHGAATGTQAAANVEQTVRVPITNVLASNVTLGITCTDTRPGNVAPAATVSWTLTYLNESVTGQACDIDERYAMLVHPDVEELRASSQVDAYASLWDHPAHDNFTGEAVLTFSWSRGSTGGLPIPNQGATFTATLAVGVLAWDANVAKATTQEAGK